MAVIVRSSKKQTYVFARKLVGFTRSGRRFVDMEIWRLIN